MNVNKCHISPSVNLSIANKYNKIKYCRTSATKFLLIFYFSGWLTSVFSGFSMRHIQSSKHLHFSYLRQLADLILKLVITEHRKLYFSISKAKVFTT